MLASKYVHTKPRPPPCWILFGFVLHKRTRHGENGFTNFARERTRDHARSRLFLQTRSQSSFICTYYERSEREMGMSQTCFSFRSPISLPARFTSAFHSFTYKETVNKRRLGRLFKRFSFVLFSFRKRGSGRIDTVIRSPRSPVWGWVCLKIPENSVTYSAFWSGIRSMYHLTSSNV